VSRFVILENGASSARRVIGDRPGHPPDATVITMTRPSEPAAVRC